MFLHVELTQLQTDPMGTGELNRLRDTEGTGPPRKHCQEVKWENN